MFWKKLFRKETVGEPVLTLVQNIKENPKKHRLTMLGDHHISFYYNGDVHWNISISHQGSHLNTCGTAEWMNKAEKIYVFNELLQYAGGDKYSRRGWMVKVMGEDNVN
ncbi:hypothetical protein [Salmonella phage NINP13076]|nr:hypothetical protein [Salmonella phage NINP13076]